MRLCILKSAQLDDAYRCLCQQRKYFPTDDDIWHFCYRYAAIKLELLQRVNSRKYRFSAQLKIIKSERHVIHLWGSQDALVMKLMANRLRASLPLSGRCTHIKECNGQVILATE